MQAERGERQAAVRRALMVVLFLTIFIVGAKRLPQKVQDLFGSCRGTVARCAFVLSQTLERALVNS